ncbi:MAG: hypothetical protein RLZZ161_1783 [Bacteroidota bacterium]|jgi:capsule polysaccharide export protein KpsE/RkpR
MFEMKMLFPKKISAKFKIILVLLILNLIGFWAAQRYFSCQESSSTPKEMVEEDRTLGANVEESGLYKEWGIRLIALFMGR